MRLGHADLRCSQNNEKKCLYIFDTRGQGGERVHKSLSGKIPVDMLSELNLRVMVRGGDRFLGYVMGVGVLV